MSVVNHIGLAVSDLSRSRAFYEGVFGFTFRSETTFPDAATSKLMKVDGKLGLHVIYLECEGWVLELLAYDDAGLTPQRARPMNEPGLTHVSICVPDIDAAIAKAIELGGTHESDRGFKGMVEIIRDPDGSPIELLPMTYRDTL